MYAIVSTLRVILSILKFSIVVWLRNCARGDWKVHTLVCVRFEGMIYFISAKGIEILDVIFVGVGGKVNDRTVSNVTLVFDEKLFSHSSRFCLRKK